MGNMSEFQIPVFIAGILKDFASQWIRNPLYPAIVPSIETSSMDGRQSLIFPRGGSFLVIGMSFVLFFRTEFWRQQRGALPPA